MANTILTPTMITREALRILHQKLNFVGTINRSYDDQFAQKGAKIGNSLNIRLPNQYTVRTGQNLSTQDTTETSTQLTVSTQKGVDLTFTSQELTMSLDDFSKRIISPAMAVLASSIEADAMSMYQQVYNQVNNQGAAMTFKTGVMGARKILNDNLAPLDNDRTMNLNTQDEVDLVDALKGLFQDSDAISEQYREGMMGRTGGFNFYENTLWPTQSRGAATTAYVTNTQVGTLPISATPVSSITIATGTGSINAGDVFTIQNVFRVHPESKATLATQQQFVALNTLAGPGVLNISPSIILAGGYQNVVIPTTSATATMAFAGTISTPYGISMAYHKDAFVFATADLLMPQGVDMAAREVQDGISMRMVRQYVIGTDTFPCRLDVLYGYKAVRPQLACRVANN
jgi:hypothetical protein